VRELKRELRRSKIALVWAVTLALTLSMVVGVSVMAATPPGANSNNVQMSLAGLPTSQVPGQNVDYYMVVSNPSSTLPDISADARDITVTFYPAQAGSGTPSASGVVVDNIAYLSANAPPIIIGPVTYAMPALNPGVTQAVSRTVLNGTILLGSGAGLSFSIVKEVSIGLEAGEACIHIEKSTNGVDADSPPGPYIPVGDPVTWVYNVTNCGSMALNITLTDSEPEVTPTYVSGDANLNGLLDLTEAWIYQASGTAAAGQYTNVGNATGTPPEGPPVSDTDPSHYFGSEPCIHIEKSTNGEDADSAPGPYILVGNPVNWVYNVTNCGNVPLSSIAVTDSQAGVAPAYVSGDNNFNNLLDLTEAWIYHASGTAGAGQYANVGTATGAPPAGPPVSDTDPSHYFGSEACIHIEKSTNGEDADSAPGPYIPVGDPVTWVYNVTNCGSVALNITVTDSEAGVTPAYVGGDDNLNGLLDLTEAWIYQASGTATAGQYANVGTATGIPAVGGPVSDTDPSHYFGLGPAIDIEKHTNGVDADTAPGPYISVNSSITWAYIVTNTGGVNLTNVVVTDDKLGLIGTVPSLPVSATQTLYAYGTAGAGQYANNATVVGHYGATEVTDWDPSHYYNRPTTVGWETYPINKVRVLLPWIGLLGAIVAGASLLVLRRRRMI
jgi:hypothetical protein